MAFAIYTPLMIAQDRAESIWELINYVSFINQFPLDTKKSMRRLKRIYTKMCRQGMSILFNKICINKEMLPRYTYIIYKHILLITTLNELELIILYTVKWFHIV